MARVTVEDCVQKVPNRFELVLLAAQRARNLSRGEELTIDRDNDKNPVVALREIADETIELPRLEQDLIKSLSRAPGAGAGRRGGARPHPDRPEHLRPAGRLGRGGGGQPAGRGAVARGPRGGDRGRARRPPAPLMRPRGGAAEPTRVFPLPLRAPDGAAAAEAQRRAPADHPPVRADGEGPRLRPARRHRHARRRLRARHAGARRSRRRENGDPYITHPLAVADILAGYRLDTASIVTGAAARRDRGHRRSPRAEIDRRFGPTIGGLVDGVTKLTRLELQSDRTKQAENFRKLVLAMSKDIRVLLVKLADRLHNMRTLHFVQSPERRQRIARETMEIYAPLAERIGMDSAEDRAADPGLRAARAGGVRHHPGPAELPARAGRGRDRGGARTS